MTEVAVAAMTRDQAERLTERARLVATTLMEARDKLAGILREANEGRVWEALDMPNIQAWTEFAFSTTPLAQLSREDRRVIVKELAAEGYGTRAIAPVVGTSHVTVKNDLDSSVKNFTDERPAPRAVHGRDGITRTYHPRPAPEPVTVDHETGEVMEDPKPPRRPLPDQFRDASMDLRKITERIERLTEDDRFPRNREQIALIHQSDLERAAAALAKIVDALTN